VRGKFLYNGWGKLKIKQGLKKKGVGSTLSREALNDIPEEDYLQTLEKAVSKKKEQLSSEKDTWKLKQKLYRFAASRGFEPDLIRECLERLM